MHLIHRVLYLCGFPPRNAYPHFNDEKNISQISIEGMWGKKPDWYYQNCQSHCFNFSVNWQCCSPERGSRRYLSLDFSSFCIPVLVVASLQSLPLWSHCFFLLSLCVSSLFASYKDTCNGLRACSDNSGRSYHGSFTGCYSVTHLYPALWDPIHYSTPGFPILYYLP